MQVFSADQLSNEQYHAEADHVSSTRLKTILKSPAHFLIAQHVQGEPSPSMKFGTAVHCALLEPDRFTSTYVEDPGFDRRTKEGRANADAFDAANPGKIKIAAEDLTAIDRIRSSVSKHATARALLELPSRVVEESIFWRDQITGIRQKVRPDLRVGLDDRMAVIDVKTARDASRFAFARQVIELDYHFSAAMYSEGIKVAYGQRPVFAWLVVEANGVICLYQPDAELSALGEKRYRRAVNSLAACIESNQWPAYQDGRSIEPLAAPKWALTAE